jgi:hypothetical protein
MFGLFGKKKKSKDDLADIDPNIAALLKDTAIPDDADMDDGMGHFDDGLDDSADLDDPSLLVSMRTQSISCI